MKPIKFEIKETLSTGKNMLSIEKDFELGNISFKCNDNLSGSINRKESKPLPNDSDFIKLRDQYNGIDNISCLSDKLDNRGYCLKSQKEETEKIETPLIMDDEAEKIYKELFKRKVKDKKQFLLKNYTALRDLHESFVMKIPNNNKKTKFITNLKMKYLKTFKEDIGFIIPTKCQIRIYEICYPLDSSFIMTDQNNKTEIPILGDQSEFKRIKQIIFDKNEEDYKYLIEEKFPEMAGKDYFQELSEYYSLWLDNQNHQQAHELALSLKENYLKDSKMNVFLNSNMMKPSDEKIYIRKISKNAQKEIKSMPYIHRLSVYNKHKVFPELIEMSVNQKYFDAVNYTPSFRDGMQGFKWATYCRTKHVLEFHIDRIITKLNFKRELIAHEPEFSFCKSCLKNEQGKVVSKRCNVWYQGWIQDNNFYSEYYMSFVLN